MIQKSEIVYGQTIVLRNEGMYELVGIGIPREEPASDSDPALWLGKSCSVSFVTFYRWIT